MSATGLPAFDTTVQKTNTWVNDVAAELGWEDKHRAFQGLRVTLHALRDRLTVDEAAQLAVQLPILLTGFYYEDWKPATNPSKERTKDQFLSHISDYFQTIEPNIDAEAIARAVFKIMSNRVSTGEIEDITGILPAEIKELWPQAVRA